MNQEHLFLVDFGRLLRERAFEAKREALEHSESDFYKGRLLAFNEVVSMLQQQVEAFQLTGDFGLADLDPDRDLV